MVLHRLPTARPRCGCTSVTFHVATLPAENKEKLLRSLTDWPFNRGIKEAGEKYIVNINGEANSSDLNKYLLENEVIVSHLSQVKTNLEQEFLKILSEHDE